LIVYFDFLNVDCGVVGHSDEGVFTEAALFDFNFDQNGLA
jgi:hypothetical protein